MNETKISVIIPVYNVEKYIDYCLESVLKQTYQNLEIILVNDGSTDTSLEHCLQYKKKDSRVKVISQKNKGLAGARNTGLDNASGDLVSFIDSDDYISPWYFETLYEGIKEQVDISMCLLHVSHSYQEIFSRPDKVYVKWSPKEFFIHALNSSGYQSACGKLYKKFIFKNLRFPEGKLHEDIFVMADIIERSCGINFIDSELYCYVKRPNSITTSLFNEKKFELVDAQKKFCKSILAKYPELSPLTSAFEIHENSILMCQVPKGKYQRFVKDTIYEARKELPVILKCHDVSTTSKLLCFSVACGRNMTKFSWNIFNKLRSRNIA